MERCQHERQLAIKVFISYSRKDNDVASRLASELRDYGFDVWIDTQISSGERWLAAIGEAIRTSSAVIVIVSSSSSKSEWVEREILLANREAKPIIPFQIDGTYLPILIDVQHIDARADWERAKEQLLAALQLFTEPKLSSTPIRSGTVMPRPSSRPAHIFEPIEPRTRRGIWFFGAILLLTLVISLAIIIVSPEFLSDTQESPTASQAAILSDTETPTNTVTPTNTLATSVSPTTLSPTLPTESLNIRTAIAQAVQETVESVGFTLTAISRTSTPTYTNTPTLSVEQRVDATLFVMRTTEENSLSPQEAGELAQLAVEASNQDKDYSITYWGIIISLIALNGFLTIIALNRVLGNRFKWRTAHLSKDSENKPEPLLNEYQVFVSSADEDKEWVKTLVKDLGELGFLVWWYAKDAPGLPFGKEIQSAIYYTKVFLIVISPDSMESKHIEEEIRWSEVYERPIVSVLYRPTTVVERLYGLAKGADIDFTNEREYKGSMEMLTQAINHHLKKRLEDIQDNSEPERNS
ncbi:MAG: toll/interleukin-1 receptor domain-containing protein [Anaerolineae bacterium]|nr:toll/interleukin-1 receptor domain-containing protein [Anaerolineae bacterium]